ncbi:MAG: UPF0058 family protein [Candidatus Hydrothermarchaeaceae archaeon]
MYKEELIHLHRLLIYLRKFLVDNGVSKSFFNDYAALNISPHHIHRTKAEHKYAIFTLAWGISKVLAENSDILPRGVANRLGEIVERCKSDMI